MYATVEDMILRYDTTELIQLSDHDGAGIVNQAVVDQAIVDACHEIDSYVSAAYKLPLPETPAMLKRYACDMARYFLYKGAATDRVKAGYDDAIAWLKSLAKGQVRLQISVENGPVVAPDATQNVQFNTPDRIMSRDRLAGY